MRQIKTIYMGVEHATISLFSHFIESKSTKKSNDIACQHSNVDY